MFSKMNFSGLMQMTLLGLLLSVVSCRTEEPVPSDFTYTGGLLVLNQGNFGQANADFSFHTLNKQRADFGIFESVNKQPLGDVAQSMTAFGDELFVVVNNSNLVRVLDGTTLLQRRSISGFGLPRYMVVRDGAKAYMSQWGSGDVPAGVAVVNLSTNTIEKVIPTGNGPERMLLDGNRLYVCNSGGFGYDNTVAVIDLTTETVIAKIEVSDGPTNILKSANTIWVLCSGVYDFGAGDFTKGALANIVGEEVKDKIELTGYPQNLVARTVGNSTVLYYTNSAGLWSSELSFGSLGIPGPRLLSGRYLYSLVFDADSGWLIAGDAVDFNSNGKVLIINPLGQVIDSFPSGIIPVDFRLD